VTDTLNVGLYTVDDLSTLFPEVTKNNLEMFEELMKLPTVTSSNYTKEGLVEQFHEYMAKWKETSAQMGGSRVWTLADSLNQYCEMKLFD
jgi:hypothetical protein